MLHLTAAEWIAARGFYSLLAVISVIGVISNFSLFYVTIRSKSLRSTCHLLIGFCALLDGLHQIGQLVQFPVLFSDGFIDSIVCSAFQVLPEIGAMGGCACALCIGMERLTAVLFMNHYRRLSGSLLTIHLLLVSGFGGYSVYLMTAYYQQMQLICAIPAPFHGAAAALWKKTLGALIISTIAVYCIVAAIISKRAEVSTATRRSFRSIFFVMTSDVSGWAITIGLLHVSTVIDLTGRSVFQILRHSFLLSDEIRFIWRYGCGLFVNTGIAAKAMIYYSTSTEYRLAFRSAFRRDPRSQNPVNASTFVSNTVEINVI